MSLVFDGRTYHIRKNGYYKSGQLWLHREIWKKAHGEIPSGCYIHHKDGNRENNSLENLECVTPTQHIANHRTPELVEKWKKNLVKACEAARHCDYRKNTEAHSLAAKKGYHKMPWYKHTCQICGQEYLSKAKESRYCSTKCKNIARLHPEKIVKVEYVGKAPVYNMTTSDHTFVLDNGAIVHNCDALRYVIKTKVNLRRLLNEEQ